MIADYRYLYRAMAERYRFGPEEVSRMTFAQIDAYLGEKRKLTAGDIQRYMEKRNG